MSYKEIAVSESRAWSKLFPARLQRNLPYVILLAIACIILVNLFITPQYMELYELVRNHFHVLQFLPSFVVPQLSRNGDVVTPLNLIQSMRGTLLFTVSFLIVFLLYFWGISSLPGRISYRYIQISTLLMGIAYMLIPALTSQDVISYTAYARMSVIYHLNPMVTPPTAIHSDYIYQFLFWIDQPSVYGPIWLGITDALQWFALFIGAKHLLSMEILLRIFGFAMHLGSMQLVWLISGRLFNKKADSNPALVQTQRLRATLAFAWNPFLLLEACVNAHNDVAILFLLLLAFWFLFPRNGNGKWYYVLTAVFLALAACIKITYIILVPGFLLFLWSQQTDIQRSLINRARDVIIATIISFGLVIAIHAPFWSHGALLNVLKITPSSSQDINSFYELIVNIYAKLTGASLKHTMDIGPHIEVISHYIGDALFAIGYAVLCLYTLWKPRYVNTPVALIGWMAFAWLYYCVAGDPWFWPWYLIMIFGFFAILEVAQDITKNIPFTFGGNLNIALFSRSLMLGMFVLYALWNFYGVLPHYGYRYISSVLVWVAPILIFGYAAYKMYVKKQSVKMDTSL